MNTVDTPIVDFQVADWDKTFGFIIELVDGESSTDCTVFARILLCHCLLFCWILLYLEKVELYISLE